MVNFKILALALAVCGLAACSDSSNSSSPSRQGRLAQDAATTDSTENAMEASDDAVMTSTVTDVSWDAAEIDPSIADEIALLDSVTSIVETDAGTYDFYAGDELLFTIGADADAVWSVSASVSELDIAAVHVEEITGEDNQGQDMSSSAFHFEMLVCEEEEAQEQEQEQNKEQGEDKDQNQGQDQNQATPQGVDQSQDKEEVKGEDKEEVKGEDCETVTVIVDAEEVEEVKQEQEQNKEQEQDKEQSQDKEEVKGEDKEQDQAQDKGEDKAQDKDQGQDQEQGEGKA